MYVISKVEESGGSIIQIIIFSVTAHERISHGIRLKRVADPLIQWMHNDALIEKGYVKDTDIPNWIEEPTRDIIISQCKLWYVHYKRLRTNNNISPSRPILLYIQLTQFDYNKEKPGLDKNTELSKRLCYNSPDAFENKYFFRLIERITINAWQAEQTIKLIRPFIQSSTTPINNESIRDRLKKLTLDDYSYNLSVGLLKFLQ